MAKDLISQHLPGVGVRFEWDNAVKRFGRCQFTRVQGILKPTLISLSRILTYQNDEDQVRDTILHEIAHALAGHKAGHGYMWKAMARKVGANPNRCYDTATVVADHHQQSPYVDVCRHCGFERPRYKRPARNVRPKAHKACCDKYNYGRFSDKYLLETKVRSRVGVGR